MTMMSKWILTHVVDPEIHILENAREIEKEVALPTGDHETSRFAKERDTIEKTSHWVFEQL